MYLLVCTWVWIAGSDCWLIYSANASCYVLAIPNNLLNQPQIHTHCFYLATAGQKELGIHKVQCPSTTSVFRSLKFGRRTLPFRRIAKMAATEGEKRPSYCTQLFDCYENTICALAVHCMLPYLSVWMHFGAQNSKWSETWFNKPRKRVSQNVCLFL